MFRHTLITAGLLVLITGTGFAADDAPITIVKQSKAARAAAGTGLQGTIAVSGSPALSCGDLTVHVGIRHATSPTLTSLASARATGTISSGQCSYAVTRLPAGGPFDVVVVPEASKSCKLPSNASLGQATFKRGALSTLDIELAPVCEAK